MQLNIKQKGGEVTPTVPLAQWTSNVQHAAKPQLPTHIRRWPEDKRDRQREERKRAYHAPGRKDFEVQLA